MAKKTKYQNVNVSEKNKRELERIKRELERFHKKDFRIDVAIGHILRVYRPIMKVMKNKEDQEKYKNYLQKL